MNTETDCKRCNGNGNIEKEYECNYCENGWKQSNCNKCNHTGICNGCKGSSVFVDTGKCSKCDGKGKYPPIGKWPCDKCNGIGCLVVSSIYQTCGKCRGSGRYPVRMSDDDCTKCNGSGFYRNIHACNRCIKSPGQCSLCKGRRVLTTKCGGCKGRGIYSVNKRCYGCDGTGTWNMEKYKNRIKNRKEIKKNSKNKQDIEVKIGCTVCMDKDKNTAIIPCGHTFCEDCCDQFEVCPICNGIITSTLKIYL